MDEIQRFLGFFLRLFYENTENFTLSIVYLTLWSKILLMPVSIWVQKNSIKQTKLQIPLYQLKTSLYGDIDALAKAQNSLYKAHHFNPFSSLVPVFIQILLLLSLIQVLYHPLTYVFQVDSQEMEHLNTLLHHAPNLWEENLEENSEENSEEIREENPLEELWLLEELGTVLNAQDTSNTSNSSQNSPNTSNSSQGSSNSSPDSPNTSQNSSDSSNSSPDSPDSSNSSPLEEKLKNFSPTLGKLSLFHLPLTHWREEMAYLWIPFLASCSALFLALLQNKVNILQGQQGFWGKYGTLGFSVGLSLYLGLQVPVAVGFYWICSNLCSALQALLLNALYPPEKEVDLLALAKAREKYQEIHHLGEEKKGKNPYKKREKEDYKEFFSVTNKKILFYAERSGYYKYYEALMTELLARADLTIHYITSDPNDQIFQRAKEEKRIKAYYIGEKRLIFLMMKLDVKICVMTMPDLEQYHIKKSRVAQGKEGEAVEYLYLFHAPLSHIMTLNHGALDHYDSVFSTGPFQTEELRQSETCYNLPVKNIIPYGYPLIETMIQEYQKNQNTPENQVNQNTPENQANQNTPENQANQRKKPLILIAPSWYEDNILDSCIHELLSSLTQEDMPSEMQEEIQGEMQGEMQEDIQGEMPSEMQEEMQEEMQGEMQNFPFHIIIRPHPEYIKRYGEKLQVLQEKYKEKYKALPHSPIEFQLNFATTSTVYQADLLITDWSLIAFEYAFTTGKPVLFVHTKMKVANPHWAEVSPNPPNLSLREEVGVSLEKDQMSMAKEKVQGLLEEKHHYGEKIADLKEKYLYPSGTQKGSDYILGRLTGKIPHPKENQNRNKGEL